MENDWDLLHKSYLKSIIKWYTPYILSWLKWETKEKF